MDTTATGLPDISLKKYDRVILALMGIATLAATFGVGYGVYLILPALLTMAENGVILLGLLIVAALFGFGLLDLALNFNNILLHMKMSAQSIRRKIISSNPIAAIDVSINNLQNQFAEASRLATEAVGATNHMEKQIHADDHKSGAQDQADNEDRLAQAAESQGRPQDEINSHLVKAERWHRSVDMLQPLLDRQRQRQARIEQARKIARERIDDLQNQKQVLSIQLAAFEADAKQSRALGAFFGKQSQDMANIEIAVDEIVKQGAQAEAEIEQMLNDAEPTVQAAQLQKAADAQAGRDRLHLKTGTAPRALGPASVPSLLAVPVKDAEFVERSKS